MFSSRFFRAMFAEVLVAGNVTREQAEATGAKLLQTLNAHSLLPDEHIVSLFVVFCETVVVAALLELVVAMFEA